MRGTQMIVAAVILGVSAVSGCPVSPETSQRGQPVGVSAEGAGGAGGALAGETRVTAKGRVLSVVDESPVDGVEVSLSGQVAATTDGEGRYEAALPEGVDIALRFDKTGFIPLFLPVQIPADAGAPELAEMVLLPSSMFGTLPGLGREPGNDEVMLLVELDKVENGSGQSVKLSARHGSAFVLGTGSGPLSSYTVPASGVDESLLVLFMDVEGTRTTLDIAGPRGPCFPAGTEELNTGSVSLNPGGVTYVYASCDPAAGEVVEEPPLEQLPPPVEGAPPPTGPPPPGAGDPAPGGAPPSVP